MQREFWYIYTLSDNGKVFYVGISRNVGNRYRQHLGCCDMATGNMVYWIRKDDRLPSLEIINVAPDQKQAELVEMSIIRHLCIMGNKLCNIDGNPSHNRIITCSYYPNRPRLPKLKHDVVPSIIEGAKTRFHKLMFYYHNDQQNRLQYMGDSARVSQ